MPRAVKYSRCEVIRIYIHRAHLYKDDMTSVRTLCFNAGQHSLDQLKYIISLARKQAHE